MIVVSDSTTLIVLAKFKRFELLANLFDEVLVPKRVWNELNHKGNLELPSWITIQEIAQDTRLTTLNYLLDAGESEAIVLALQRNLPLIIDEKKGRKIAKQMGLEILGLLGIIYLNIKKNKITKLQAQEFLDEVISQGFRISQTLINTMLEKVK